MRIRNLIATLAAAAAALAATGCGEKCASESPAQIADVGTCSTLPPNAPVTVELRICPTCNQTLPGCSADIQGGFIQLDPVVEACEDPSSCPPAPSCAVPVLSCRFTSPASGTYTILVYNPATNSNISRTVTIADGAPTTCALASGT